MSTYKPTRKTSSGTEEVKFPMSSIEGLEDALKQSGGATVDKIKKVTVLTRETIDPESDDVGIYWTEDVIFNGEKSNTLAKATISQHVPIAAGDNVTLTVDEEAQVIKINAEGGGGSENSVLSVSVSTGYMSYMSEIISAIQAVGGDIGKLTFVTLSGFATGDLLIRFANRGGSRYKVECINIVDLVQINCDPSSDNVIDVSSTRIADFLAAGKTAMPQIRFVGMPCDGKWGFYEDPELMDGEISYPIVKFTVEITSGAVQVGDTIQLCRMAKYGALFHEDGSIRRGARRKLRRMAEYAITYDDIGKRFITFDVDPMLWEKAMRLFTRTNHSSQGGISMSPMYFRIRRPKGELQTNESRMTVDAEFSNVVTVWKTCQAWQNSEGDDCGILRII